MALASAVGRMLLRVLRAAGKITKFNAFGTCAKEEEGDEDEKDKANLY